MHTSTRIDKLLEQLSMLIPSKKSSSRPHTPIDLQPMTKPAANPKVNLQLNSSTFLKPEFHLQFPNSPIPRWISTTSGNPVIDKLIYNKLLSDLCQLTLKNFNAKHLSKSNVRYLQRHLTLLIRNTHPEKKPKPSKAKPTSHVPLPPDSPPLRKFYPQQCPKSFPSAFKASVRSRALHLKRPLTEQELHQLSLSVAKQCSRTAPPVQPQTSLTVTHEQCASQSALEIVHNHLCRLEQDMYTIFETETAYVPPCKHAYPASFFDPKTSIIQTHHVCCSPCLKRRKTHVQVHGLPEDTPLLHGLICTSHVLKFHPLALLTGELKHEDPESLPAPLAPSSLLEELLAPARAAEKLKQDQEALEQKAELAQQRSIVRTEFMAHLTRQLQRDTPTLSYTEYSSDPISKYLLKHADQVHTPNQWTRQFNARLRETVLLLKIEDNTLFFETYKGSSLRTPSSISLVLEI
jgi:hypothetical protein